MGGVGIMVTAVLGGFAVGLSLGLCLVRRPRNDEQERFERMRSALGGGKHD